MAFLEAANSCAVCDGPCGGGHSGGFPIYLCPTCYAQWQTEYHAREAWVAYLENAEKQRRKRRNRLLKGAGLPQFTNTLQGELL